MDCMDLVLVLMRSWSALTSFTEGITRRLAKARERLVQPSQRE